MLGMDILDPEPCEDIRVQINAISEQLSSQKVESKEGCKKIFDNLDKLLDAVQDYTEMPRVPPSNIGDKTFLELRDSFEELIEQIMFDVESLHDDEPDPDEDFEELLESADIPQNWDKFIRHFEAFNLIFGYPYKSSHFKAEDQFYFSTTIARAKNLLQYYEEKEKSKK